MPISRLSFREKRIDRRIAAYQSDLLATHYAEVENMYRQIRGWRHDYRNHIQVLKSYLDMGDVQAASAYLEALSEDLNTVDPALKTGNKMTDIILNSKISLARSKKNSGGGGRPCAGGPVHGGDRSVYHHRKSL